MDTSNSSYGEDITLRAAGFTIHSRPAHGPVLWRCRDTGHILTQAQARQYALFLLQGDSAAALPPYAPSRKARAKA